MTKTQKSEIGRALAALRKTRSGGRPPNLEGTPEELERRRKKREEMRKYRAKLAARLERKTHA